MLGCATRGGVHEVQSQLSALRSEIAALRLSQEDAAHDGSRARTELRALEARMESLAASVRDTRADLGRLQAEVDVANRSLRELRDDVARKPAPAPAMPPPPVGTPPPRAGAADAAYQSAVALFQAREHGQAVLQFLDFLARYPGHPLGADAQYWIGEAYYVQRDFRQAMVEFRKVLDHAAAGGKVAEALLKIGLCQAALQQPGSARQTWQRLVREHPDSDAATRARPLLETAAGSDRP
jgi:tol-pal system protein YbgF